VRFSSIPQNQRPFPQPVHSCRRKADEIRGFGHGVTLFTANQHFSNQPSPWFLFLSFQ
jgi:hypothetical protein